VRSAAGRAATPDRHAIELRISAEDPAREFAPVPGRITRWREPGGPGVRNDSGVQEGGLVSREYDPMLAKVLVVASDRDAALARARRAIDEFETGGVQTTLPFHAWLLRHAEFIDGRLRTDLVERDWDPGPLRAAAMERAAKAVAAHVWAADGRHVPAAPVRPPGTPGAVDTPGWKPEPWS
jgi:acetyl/propionyl-CoA carboxylase alpha subunit